MKALLKGRYSPAIVRPYINGMQSYIDFIYFVFIITLWQYAKGLQATGVYCPKHKYTCSYHTFVWYHKLTGDMAPTAPPLQAAIL